MKTPLGKMRLVANDEGLTRVDFSDVLTAPESECVETKILQQAKKELTEYFAGVRTHFESPLAMKGTEFQRAVWQELLKIPFGTTTTYGEMAKRMQLGANSARAVGLANGQNPVAIIVPCHRVIGAQGQLVGYAGGIDRKSWLLKHECSTLV